VTGTDLHHADVIADLTVPDGRAALADGVAHITGGRIDAIVANAGGGPPETSVALNVFGAVATLRTAYGSAPKPEENPLPDQFQAPLDLYGTAKLAAMIPLKGSYPGRRRTPPRFSRGA
jgi:hypothetical protein